MASVRLRLLSAALRLAAKPVLRRTATPQAAERDFARTARLLFRPPPGLVRQTARLGGVPVHWLRRAQADTSRAILYLHGGAFVSGSGNTHAGLAARLAGFSGVPACLPDYRLLQDAPFPAAFDDALAAWDGLRALGYPARRIALAGDSAGGGLALALLARLLARGERPAGLLALSPWADLTLSGATLRTRSEALIPWQRMAEVADRYLDGAPADDPRASALFADWAAPPPVLIQASPDECLYDDATRIADRLRRAGGAVTLDPWPGAPHVWQIFAPWLPEADAALRRGGAFLQTSFVSASR